MTPRISAGTWGLVALLLLLMLAHAVSYHAGEPFFNGDETRHLMSGVFFRDLLIDFPVSRLRDYATQYYLQYPALGLVVWPPLFYGIEGLWMLIFGTSLLAAKILIGAFSALSCIYLFRLVSWTHRPRTALLAVAIYALSPMIFTFASQVMLETPSLAFGLAATFYAVRYLDEERPRDGVWAALGATAAALTRFDGIWLLPLFGIFLASRRRFHLLRRKEVLAGAAIFLLAVAPVYALTAKEFGWVHANSITGSANDGSPPLTWLDHVLFYPSQVPVQIGWLALAPLLAGLAASLTAERRRRALPYLAMLGVTYALFTPIGEIEPRHVIFWIPALAFFAAEGIGLLWDWPRARKLGFVAAGIVIAGSTLLALMRPAPFVSGYERAAQYVISNSNAGSRLSLFDGWLDGGFIYQIRRHDPERQRWTLRGDKLFYSAISGTNIGYTEFARSDQDILDTVFRYDPEFLVVESLRPSYQPPMAVRLRNVLQSHTERFSLDSWVPLETNLPNLRGVRLEIYRNRMRNPHPDPRVQFEMLGLRRSLQTVIPPAK